MVITYSEEKRENCAKSVVGFLIHTKYMTQIEECTYASDRILTFKRTAKHRPMNIIGVYSPENYNQKKHFYESLQITVMLFSVKFLFFGGTSSLTSNKSNLIRNSVIPKLKYEMKSHSGFVMPE